MFIRQVPFRPQNVRKRTYGTACDHKVVTRGNGPGKHGTGGGLA